MPNLPTLELAKMIVKAFIRDDFLLIIARAGEFNNLVSNGVVRAFLMDFSALSG